MLGFFFQNNSRGKCLVSVCKSCLFCLRRKVVLYSKFYLFRLHSICDQPLGKINYIACTLDDTQTLRVSNPKRACMHILMVSSCECVLIKLVASSQNSASRRTLPKVQDLFQGSLVIKNEASTFCKIEILCIRLRAL